MDRTSRSPHRTFLIAFAGIILVGLIAIGVWVMSMSSPDLPSQVAPGASQDQNTDTTTDQNSIAKRQVKIVYIADGDNGKIGEKIGCDDSAVVISKAVDAVSAGQGALQALLADKSEKYGTTGLRNALWQSDLSLDLITINDQTADVKLSGDLQLAGVCDNPRVKAQLEGTVKESTGVNMVNVMINDKTLDEVLSLR